MLQTHREFAGALHKCRSSPDETQQLIVLRGALLAEQNRAKSRLSKPAARLETRQLALRSCWKRVGSSTPAELSRPAAAHTSCALTH